ncbi:RIP metalloprotease RseP [Zobellia galactanivorans]|uniref:RIP metalloprotease RseP n=1 Tax=Zobellia galactanivorans (strain DSM 12802 / CCUG 47099 / CIP 106680 / NCIMB 13871 / Dsij) TaxID=63186 RepID=UPI001C065997|nr:RIP metalloprotease RseP [Zobellia galactanivorans]MBU3026485.1 RIP metalloprotease RseP [Zobellia galactanivorans]MDO6809372.1 RIP metalloprotease RseP [Zobellia galactanivorans]
MSPLLIKTIQFLLSLSLLIVLHEMGHFIPAKLFKTRVEKFYLFFDVKFSLFKKKIGETVYGIGWLPLGGYVKIAGMIDESMDTEAMKEEPKEWEFRSKPAWQRLIIMLGGVTVNFILALVIYIGMAYGYGDQYIPADSLKDGVHVIEKTIGDELGIQTGDKILAVDGNKVKDFNGIFMSIIEGNSITIERDGQTIEQAIPVDFIATLMEDKDRALFLGPRIPFIIGEVSPGSLNKEAGLEPQDEVVEIAGKKVTYFDEVKPILENHKGEKIDLTVVRENNERKVIPVVINDSAQIGVRPMGLSMEDMEQRGLLRVETEKYTFAQSIPAGINKGVSKFTGYLKQLKKIFNPDTGAYKGVGGFAAIGGLFPNTWNWEVFWGTTAFLSIMLGVLNLLPIPALDGGHVMFLLYEIVSGRKPSDKFLEYAQMIGFFLLLALILFANGNDLYRYLTGK